MCISRAALFPAHAERTCSVALLNTYHGRISASNSPQLQIPANENAQKREGERGRERTPRDTKSEPNPTQIDTTQVGGSAKAVTFPTHLQTWLMWVFVSVGVYVMHDTLFTDMLTLPSWNSWESFNPRSCNITRGRAEAQYPERRRHPVILGETSLSNLPQSEQNWAHWKTSLFPQFLLGKKLNAHWTHFRTASNFWLHGAGVLRTAIYWLFHLSSKDFCSSLETFTDVCLQVLSKQQQQEKWITVLEVRLTLTLCLWHLQQ